MDTPTSQARPASDRLPIDEALARLAAGDLGDLVVDALSDLSQNDARRVALRWGDLRPEDREALVRRAIEVAETDLSKEFGRLLRLAVGDGSEAVRQLAVVGLWEDQRPDLVGLLLDVVDGDPSVDVRAAALVTLGGHLEQRELDALDEADAQRLRDVLLELAEDEDDTSILRRAAVEALGGLGDDDEAGGVIRLAAADDDAALRAAALYAMGTTRDGRWQPLVVAALASEDADVRTAAARAVGLIGVTDAVVAVVDLASDEDDEVRHAAIAALGAIGDPPSTRALRVLLQDPLPGDEPLLEAALDEAMIATEAARGEPSW